jgi:hypothetical protein
MERFHPKQLGRKMKKIYVQVVMKMKFKSKPIIVNLVKIGLQSAKNKIDK